MKDLDFDELDRAVNSLMTGAPKGASSDSKSESTEKMLTINPTLSQDNKSSFSAAIEKSAAQAGQVLERPAGGMRATTPPAARRAGGRFMDVVHPSSDMKTVSRPVSREGVSLTPPLSRSADMPKQYNVAPATPAQPISPSPSQPVPSPSMPVPTPVDESGSKSEWPDPIALQDFEQEQTVTADAPASSQANTTSRSDSSLDTEAMAEPLSTPFLSDTKVEKRPLGAFATDLHSKASLQKDESQAQSNQQNEDASKQLAADPVETLEETQPELPAELHSELMKIESDQVAAPEVATVPASKPSTAMSVRPVSEPAGPASISQQYREEPSTGDSEHAAIFDTDSYHQPLAHPAKHKSGWMMVVWIILLLAVGAGGAAALYFSGII